MTPMRLAVSVLASVATAFLGACVNVHPRYRAEAVVWDPALVGAWQAVDADGRTVALSIEPREVRVGLEDGRINPEPPGVSRPGAGDASGVSPRTVRQYLLTYTTPDGAAWRLEGYLLQSGATRFLAFQRSDPFIEENAGWVLPVHLLWKVEQSPDVLEFWSPRDGVAWIPAIQWADAPDDGGDRPIPRVNPEGSRPGIRVAESLDRVLEYHARNADDASFWHTDQAMRFRRAVPAGFR